MNSRINTRALWGLAFAFLFAGAVSVAQTFEVMHSFTPAEGNEPQSGLVQLSNGLFVGTTVGDAGTLFEMDSRGHFRTLHVFDWNFEGANPHAPLLVGEDGSLYGTTMNGLVGWGGIFKFDRSGELNVLKTFVPSTIGLEGEGATPHAPLIWVANAANSGDAFYGVTTRGGKDGLGTIFAMDSRYGVRTLHHFSGYDGAFPFESLIYLNGYLYGTTTAGGTTNGGTIFRMTCGGSNFRVLHSFNRTDGIEPQAPLIAVNGMLYGTTYLGGSHNLGTVFKFDPSTGRMFVIHNFNGNDGANPHAGLVLARDGFLYGTTYQGGNLSVDCPVPSGTIFRIEPTMNHFSVIHTFNGFDGAQSQSRLIEASDGSLYGTAARGGSDNLGVIFRLVFVRVESITPTSGPASGGVEVSIAGANFQQGATVAFAGHLAEKVYVASDTSITAVTPILSPGTLSDVVVDNPDITRGGKLAAYFADFLDVPQGDVFHAFVEKIVRNGIAVGFGDGEFGRDLTATRAQMAVFLLKAKYGLHYVPPPAAGNVFADVPESDPFAPWIEQLFREGITNGCDGGGLYCPNAPMTREHMAVMLLKAKYGSEFVPQACGGLFLDVPCSSPYARWIEQLLREQITGGCGGGAFCPAAPVTRGQMAVFLVKTFILQ